MDDITHPSNIIQKLDEMHCNMVTDGSWLNTNEKDTKIVALTSTIQEVKKKYGELAKKISFNGGPKGGSSNKKSSASSAPGKQQTKTCCPENGKSPRKATPLITRVANMSPKHASKDGSINGLYMPSPL
jgi:hypothetical protein